MVSSARTGSTPIGGSKGTVHSRRSSGAVSAGSALEGRGSMPRPSDTATRVRSGQAADQPTAARATASAPSRTERVAVSNLAAMARLRIRSGACTPPMVSFKVGEAFSAR